MEGALVNRTKISTPKIISALSARTQFGQIMRRASGEKRERFIVDRRGEPKIVIMGVKDFLENIAPEPEILAAIRAESKRNKTSKLSMRSIDTEIAAYRKEQALKNAKNRRRA